MQFLYNYYLFCMSFGETMVEGNVVGIVEFYLPTDRLIAQAKNVECNQDILLITVVTAIFSLLYIITYRWIRTLENSVDFLRDIAAGRTPDEEIHLGKRLRLSGLERQLNLLRKINMDRLLLDEDEK